MIINNSSNFIFIHIPKTAGTSFSSLVSGINRVCDVEIGVTKIGEDLQEAYIKKYGVSKHTNARVLKNALGDMIWGKYEKFTIVRDPLSRVFSAYHFLKSWPGTSLDILNILNAYDFNDFVLSDAITKHQFPDNIFFPQSYWVCDQDNNLMVDFYGKTEDLKSFVLEVIERYKLSTSLSSLQHHVKGSLNISDHKNEIGASTMDKVRQIYSIDYANFLY